MKFIKELQFKCINIFDGVKIFLCIEGMLNVNDLNVIDMGNLDIGVVIEGVNGKILVLNDVSVNQELSVLGFVDDMYCIVLMIILVYFISIIGKLLVVGDFEGIVIMCIDVE